LIPPSADRITPIHLQPVKGLSEAETAVPERQADPVAMAPAPSKETETAVKAQTLALSDAVNRLPAGLRHLMEEKLKIDFREVRESRTP